MGKNKKAILWRQIGLWILGLAALVLIALGIFLLKEKGVNLLEKLAEILRFGR